ncbi:hypothetical protein [Thioclava kandeliae]|uniref:Uncharacterized protein n=1 Tax=Thioclava kandeliae TaxID=3070818 RepID=A0ABV1SFB5_9RHOB
MLDALMAALAPYIMQLLALAVTALVGWIAAEVKKRFGVEIEAKHREALHSALMTGAQLALSRLGAAAGTTALTQAAVAYAKTSVPDAIAKLGPSAAVLQDLAEAKVSGQSGLIK